MIIKIKYNNILIITDKLIKYVYFISYIESFTSKNISYTFLRNIYTNYKILFKIISDKDKLFILKF